MTTRQERKELRKLSKAFRDYGQSLSGEKMSKTETASGGVGFGSLLFLLFLGLKLGHVINWSWWWVTAPLWVPFALLATILVVGLVVALVVTVVKKD